MSAAETIFRKSNRRIALLAFTVLALDQLSKWLVLQTMVAGDEKIIIPGFFKFVLWGNTGAAWSLFSGNNSTLIIVMLLAFVALFLTRHHFDVDKLSGQIAFGLLFGGIAGNLADRLIHHEVVDFLRFYMVLRGGYGQEVGFPAFNFADTAICTGVGLIFLITWRNEHAPKNTTA